MVKRRIVAPPAARVGVVSQPPEPPENILRPMTPAPARAIVSPITSESMFCSPPSWPCASRHWNELIAHSCSCLAALAERLFLRRVGAGDEAFERNGEVSEDHEAY